MNNMYEEYICNTHELNMYLKYTSCLLGFEHENILKAISNH